MARKMITREITSTKLSIAKMEVVDGLPQAVILPDEVLIGNVSMEKAQKEMNKKFGEPITILTLKTDTNSYELPVDVFLAHATVKEQPAEQE